MARRYFNFFKQSYFYALGFLLLGWLSQQLDVLPTSVGLFLFYAGVWALLVLSVIFGPYMLWRWFSVDEFDRWANLGLVSVTPLMVVWLWIGPTNFAKPVLDDFSTNTEVPLHGENIEFRGDGAAQQSAYPWLRTWYEPMDDDAIKRRLAAYAAEQGWEKLATDNDGDSAYRVASPGLSLRYNVIIRVNQHPMGSRIDMRVMAVDRDRDYGYGALLIRQVMAMLDPRYSDD